MIQETEIFSLTASDTTGSSSNDATRTWSPTSLLLSAGITLEQSLSKWRWLQADTFQVPSLVKGKIHFSKCLNTGAEIESLWTDSGHMTIPEPITVWGWGWDTLIGQTGSHADP